MAGRNKWSRVSILTALLDEVETIIENSPQLGYPSASSFVNDAVRRLLEKCRCRTGENEAGNPKTTSPPLKTTLNSQQTLKAFLREVVLTTAGELHLKIDPENLDKIITAIVQKLSPQ